MSHQTTVEKLLSLDATLKYLAGKRTAAAVADNLSDAAKFDMQWSTFDNERQQLTAGATDRDLIDYEIARHRVRRTPGEV